ncbi:peptide chain release factor N(5)-glutamine methyltransferase [Deferribacter autotrophicus]|uniref:peptide chain release factor N(5)-glutamine methyltransferase n=1 Tax=Deferribacter autotrophicus TaxID=500465 RepID=A0A5A8F2K9_9BACT|nr:peptide chain release factor N(5)-glutamine methyltransferase [Deferribacter autotrophicus]KAA0257729.1 peptide chain release factor N(5)-glutamine methyltransferase [Deferribacter autotrophicus]
MSLKKGQYYRLFDIYTYIVDNFSHVSRSQVKELLSFVYKIPYENLIFFFQHPFPVNENLLNVLQKVEKKYPISYITKKRHFYGYDFYVDENVLIPRYETEILVEEALKRVNKGIMLDLCTGSGCIPISMIKNNENLKAVAVDISFRALQIAWKNAVNLEVNERFIPVCFDVLQIDNLFKQGIYFDIITCNPPYVDRMDNYEESILYEPEEALFAEDEGLIFYKKLLYKLPNLCKKDGFIIFEVPHNKRDNLFEIFKGREIELKKDLSGKERVLIWKNS